MYTDFYYKTDNTLVIPLYFLVCFLLLGHKLSVEKTDILGIITSSDWLITPNKVYATYILNERIEKKKMTMLTSSVLSIPYGCIIAKQGHKDQYVFKVLIHLSVQCGFIIINFMK